MARPNSILSCYTYGYLAISQCCRLTVPPMQPFGSLPREHRASPDKRGCLTAQRAFVISQRVNYFGPERPGALGRAQTGIAGARRGMKKPKTKKVRPSPKGPRSGKRKTSAKPAAASRARPAQAKLSSSARARKVLPQKPARDRSSPPAKRKPTAEEIAHQHAMERFENALQLFNQHQLARARGMFERLTEIPSRDLAERARVYVRICDQRLARTTLQLKTTEDYYNYAVGLANEGNAEEP